MGGLISLLTTATSPETFQGQSLICPFLGHCDLDRETLAKILPFAKLMNYVAPTYAFSLKDPDYEKKTWCKHFGDDSLCKWMEASAQNVIKSQHIVSTW